MENNRNSLYSYTTHLGVFAHQDDTEFSAFHGINECYDSKSKYFSAVIVGDGAGSPRTGKYKNYTDSQMQTVRMSEQQKAAGLGKYITLTQYMIPSREIKDNNNPETVRRLYDTLMMTKPEIIYTHNIADKHDTHVAVVMRLIKAIRMMPHEHRPKRLLGCESWRSLDWMNEDDKVILDCSHNPELAEQLLMVFESQIEGGKNYARAIMGRRASNATFANTHQVDNMTHATIAMDITPLIKDDSLDPIEFVKRHILKFAEAVISKVKLYH